MDIGDSNMSFNISEIITNNSTLTDVAPSGEYTSSTSEEVPVDDGSRLVMSSSWMGSESIGSTFQPTDEPLIDVTGRQYLEDNGSSGAVSQSDWFLSSTVSLIRDKVLVVVSPDIEADTTAWNTSSTTSTVTALFTDQFTSVTSDLISPSVVNDTWYHSYGNVHDDNASMNSTADEYSDWGSSAVSPPPLLVILRHSSVVYMSVTCVLLGLIILATIVGNVFVIAAVVLERNLHSVANYLIASLAVADLMVAALVMPLAAVNELFTRWFLGREACDAFISFDVLCCTASILHLVAISVDRYWAVTRADYIHNRPARRIIIMIALSWAISTVISIPPLFGWKSPDSDPDSTGVCLISQDWGYTVYSTVGAFYMPLAVMIVIYLNVYRAARLRIRKKHFRQRQVASQRESTRWIATLMNGARGRSATPMIQNPSLETPTMTNCQLPSQSDIAAMAATQPPTPTSPNLPDPTQTMSMSPLLVDSPAAETNGTEPTTPANFHSSSPTTATSPVEMTSSQRLSMERRAKKKREQNRERKAARTLGVITGSFVVCWLPFFILALLRPFCGDACDYPDLLVSVIIWLGYFNSLLNPVIYTIFNPDFRSAFRKILFGKYRKVHSASSRVNVGGLRLGHRSTNSTNSARNGGNGYRNTPGTADQPDGTSIDSCCCCCR